MFTLLLLTLFIALMFYSTVYDVLLYLPDPPTVHSWTWEAPLERNWTRNPAPTTSNFDELTQSTEKMSIRTANRMAGLGNTHYDLNDAAHKQGLVNLPEEIREMPFGADSGKYKQSKTNIGKSKRMFGRPSLGNARLIHIPLYEGYPVYGSRKHSRISSHKNLRGRDRYHYMKRS